MNKEILTKFKEYLEAKELFLNARWITIDKLRKICDKLETSVNIGKHAKIEEKGKLISASGNAFNSFTFGIIKALGEIIQSLNVFSKRKLSTKLSAEFQKDLVTDETNLKFFANAYFSLIDIIKNNKELKISSDIVKLLRLEDKQESEELRLFNIDHEIYEVATNIWKEKTYLPTEEMKKTIELLNENLKELKSNLNQEQKWFVDLQKQDNNPAKNGISEETSLFGNIPWGKIGLCGVGGLILIVPLVWLSKKCSSLLNR